MTTDNPREGYLIDYISGIEVKATPEEVDAVQVFSKQLVEDYQYDKSQIQTRPQWRVKVSPSDKSKSYPVDIAIFADSKKNEDDVLILVECKQKTRKDGIDAYSGEFGQLFRPFRTLWIKRRLDLNLIT